jgi:hypothetical protein
MVLTALVDALSDDSIAHAAVEVEMLVWTHPALTDEQWARHLRMACELYREAGHRLLLVAQTLDTDADADVAELLDAVGADEVFLVRLEAEPASLVERIIEREPPSWLGLWGLVEHAQELAGTMPGLAGVDLVFSTEGERAEDVAAGIRAARPDWLSSAVAGRARLSPRAVQVLAAGAAHARRRRAAARPSRRGSHTRAGTVAAAAATTHHPESG